MTTCKPAAFVRRLHKHMPIARRSAAHDQKEGVLGVLRRISKPGKSNAPYGVHWRALSAGLAVQHAHEEGCWSMRLCAAIHRCPVYSHAANCIRCNISKLPAMALDPSGEGLPCCEPPLTPSAAAGAGAAGPAGQDCSPPSTLYLSSNIVTLGRLSPQMRLCAPGPGSGSICSIVRLNNAALQACASGAFSR